MKLLAWIVGGAISLLLATAGVMVYQRIVVADGIETLLATSLRSECQLIGNLIINNPSPAPIRLGSMPSRRLTLIGADGTVLVDSAAEARQMANHDQRPEVQLARRDGFGMAKRTSETTGLLYLYAAERLPDGRVVRVAAPLTMDRAWLDQQAMPVLIATALVLLGGGTLLVGWQVRSRLRVSDLVEVSRAFAAGDLSRRVALRGHDAFAHLGHELNHLGSRLKASQDDVIHQRALLDGALGSLAEGVACVDALDRIVYANPAFRQFAAGGADVLGDAFYRHLPNDAVGTAITALRAADTTAALSTVRPPSFEHRRRHLQPSLALGGPGIVVLVLHDRTEVVRAETARRDFLSSISHELKTPLTAIVGYTDTLLDGALDDPDTAKTMVTSIGRHSERLLELVRDVLTLTRLEQGAWLVRPESVDWVALLHTILDDHRPAATRRPCTLTYRGPTQCPGSTDPELIRQLVGNLVSNAIRYNRADGSVTVGLDTLVDDEGVDRVELTIADTGIGIPVEHRERIFERFYRVDAHRNRATGGTGLGLAIVKHLAEVLHGTIHLDSSAAGTTFRIRLATSSRSSASSAVSDRHHQP